MRHGNGVSSPSGLSRVVKANTPPQQGHCPHPNDTFKSCFVKACLQNLSTDYTISDFLKGETNVELIPRTSIAYFQCVRCLPYTVDRDKPRKNVL